MLPPYVEQLLRNLSDQFGIAVAVFDADGNVEFANDEGIQVMGSAERASVCDCGSQAAACAGPDSEGRAVELHDDDGGQWTGWVWWVTERAFAAALRRRTGLARKTDALVKGGGLRAQEAQLALQVMRGLTNDEIACRLQIPVGTVKTRVRALTRKLAVRNRASASAAIAYSVAPMNDDGAPMGSSVLARSWLGRTHGPGESSTDLGRALELLLARIAHQFGIALVGFDARGRIECANQAGMAILASKNRTWVCGEVLRVGRAVRRTGSGQNIELCRDNCQCWSGRVWEIGEPRLVAMLRCRYDRGRVIHALIAKRGLEPGEARLAFHVMAGRTNSDVARLYRIPTGTVKSRVWFLCRKLDARNRAALAAAVVGALYE